MNIPQKTLEMENRKVLISTLWTIVMLNMIYADILGFMSPGFLQGLLTGYAEQVKITQELLLVAAIVLEIPIAMVLLSRVLKYGANRWANIIAGILTIAFVIFGGSLALTYIFFATIEVVSMMLIVWLAWKWPNPESSHSHAAIARNELGGN